MRARRREPWGVEGTKFSERRAGLSRILFGVAIALTGRIPRPIGYLMALSGIAYVWQGLVLGSEGFSAANTTPQLLAYLLIFAWSIWLVVFAWRMKESTDQLRASA